VPPSPFYCVSCCMVLLCISCTALYKYNIGGRRSSLDCHLGCDLSLLSLHVFVVSWIFILYIRGSSYGTVKVLDDSSDSLFALQLVVCLTDCLPNGWFAQQTDSLTVGSLNGLLA